MGLNEQFLAQPQQFAGMYTLYPYADTVTNMAQMKSLAIDGAAHLTQVQGANKVAYCDILPATQFQAVPADIGGSYHGEDDLFVMRITYNRRSASSIPVYYLPWQIDHVMRIKLKPSRKHPTTEGALFWSTTVEPDVFVTAAVQGCSIFVDGEPDQPVVYHANAMSTDGPQGETLDSPNDVDVQTAAQAKIARMTDLHQKAMAQHPKEAAKLGGMRGQLSPQATSRAAHALDYMPDKLPSRKLNREAELPANLPVKGMSQFGTVFGCRKNGTWTFYRQTRTRFDFRTHDGGWKYYWAKPVCTRFWP